MSTENETSSCPTRFVVVAGYYNKDRQNEFIQALGCFDNPEQAYGKAILHLNEMIDDPKTSCVTPIFQLEGDTGYGMEVKHENFTDFAYVLFI